jgi:hypothetical protein
MDIVLSTLVLASRSECKNANLHPILLDLNRFVLFLLDNLMLCF